MDATLSFTPLSAKITGVDVIPSIILLSTEITAVDATLSFPLLSAEVAGVDATHSFTLSLFLSSLPWCFLNLVGVDIDT